MEFQPWLFEPEADVFYLNAGDTHPQWLTRDYFHSLFNLFSFSFHFLTILFSFSYHSLSGPLPAATERSVRRVLLVHQL
jgi:hypothetical protein